MKGGNGLVGGIHSHGHARGAGTNKSRLWLGRGSLELDLVLGARGDLSASVDGSAKVSVAMNQKTVCLFCFCLDTGLCHACLVEGHLSARLDLLNTLHGLEGGGDKLAVVADGEVALLFEFERRVDRHLLAIRLAEGLGPSKLAWVALQFEVLVAFRLAKLEHLCIVTNKSDTFAWVARGRAEEAVLDPHCGGSGVCVVAKRSRWWIKLSWSVGAIRAIKRSERSK